VGGGDRERLRRIFGTERDEVNRGCRKLTDVELNNFCSFKNIIKAIKSKQMRWTGHVACMGKRRNAYKNFQSGNMKGLTKLGI
jgi:hypothetical protein